MHVNMWNHSATMSEDKTLSLPLKDYNLVACVVLPTILLILFTHLVIGKLYSSDFVIANHIH